MHQSTHRCTVVEDDEQRLHICFSRGWGMADGYAAAPEQTVERFAQAPSLSEGTVGGKQANWRHDNPRLSKKLNCKT